MKYPIYAIIAVAATVTIGCNKKKTAIDQNEQATLESIDARKQEVSKDAKHAAEQVDAYAKIDKANIQANNVAIQAQLDAEKKEAEAKAEAAKAGVDIEK